jgi:hypothetical protein
VLLLNLSTRKSSLEQQTYAAAISNIPSRRYFADERLNQLYLGIIHGERLD